MNTTTQAQAQPAESAEPLFWYRPRSDGGYDIASHNDRIEGAHNHYGAWVPVLPDAAPVSAGTCLDELPTGTYRRNLQTNEPAASADISESKIAILADAMRWADVRNNYHSVEELHKSNRDFGLRIESELRLVAERAAEDVSIAAPVSAEPVAALRFDRGTPGRENEIPTVVSCNRFPDGEYEVYAAPVAAQAQQPVSSADGVPDALEETQTLLAAMLHEQRPRSEIEAQMIENRAALAQQDANQSIYPDWASYRQGLEDGKSEAQQDADKVDAERWRHFMSLLDDMGDDDDPTAPGFPERLHSAFQEGSAATIAAIDAARLVDKTPKMQRVPVDKSPDLQGAAELEKAWGIASQAPILWAQVSCALNLVHGIPFRDVGLIADQAVQEYGAAAVSESDLREIVDQLMDGTDLIDAARKEQA